MIATVKAEGRKWTRRVTTDDQELVKKFLEELAEKASENGEVVRCEFS